MSIDACRKASPTSTAAEMSTKTRLDVELVRRGLARSREHAQQLLSSGRVRVGGMDVELTDQEFRLLHLLAARAGIVFSREALLAKIWHGDTFVTVRSVDTLVKRLRRRIEPDPARPRYLLTVWGVGYKFADVQ